MQRGKNAKLKYDRCCCERCSVTLKHGNCFHPGSTPDPTGGVYDAPRSLVGCEGWHRSPFLTHLDVYAEIDLARSLPHLFPAPHWDGFCDGLETLLLESEEGIPLPIPFPSTLTASRLSVPWAPRLSLPFLWITKNILKLYYGFSAIYDCSL